MKYYEAYAWCEMHGTKHWATISTGHGDNMTKENIQQMRDALANDLIEEYPWCHKARALKIKFSDVTAKTLKKQAWIKKEIERQKRENAAIIK